MQLLYKNVVVQVLCQKKAGFTLFFTILDGHFNIEGNFSVDMKLISKPVDY